MIENIAISALTQVFDETLTDSESTRLRIFAEYRDFYENDKEQIEEWIDKTLEDHGYSKKTREALRIQHLDIIQKILNLKIAGIYETAPIRRLIVSEEEDKKEYFDLSPFLIEWDFNNKMKEVLRRAIFFNTVLTQVIKRNETIQLDLITGDECVVETNINDYLVADKIYLKRADPKTNEIIIAYWSRDEHYILDANGNKNTEWNGEKLVNKYGLLPFETIRLRAGLDYWGEPNNNLLFRQKEIDISLTNFKWTTELQSFGIPIAINLGDALGQEAAFSPNRLIKVDNVRSEMQLPDLKFVTPNIDFNSLRENIDWEIKETYLSEGLSAASSSTETSLQSGVSKGYDEIEIQMQREGFKMLMQSFEKRLLNLLRTVNNIEFPNNKIPDGEFEVIYSKEKPAESINDKKLRREMDKQYFIADEVDFVMEDKNLQGEDEALKYIEKRKARASQFTQGGLFNNLLRNKNKVNNEINN